MTPPHLLCCLFDLYCTPLLRLDLRVFKFSTVSEKREESQGKRACLLMCCPNGTREMLQRDCHLEISTDLFSHFPWTCYRCCPTLQHSVVCANWNTLKQRYKNSCATKHEHANPRSYWSLNFTKIDFVRLMYDTSSWRYRRQQKSWKAGITEGQWLIKKTGW